MDLLYWHKHELVKPLGVVKHRKNIQRHKILIGELLV